MHMSFRVINYINFRLFYPHFGYSYVVEILRESFKRIHLLLCVLIHAMDYSLACLLVSIGKSFQLLS